MKLFCSGSCRLLTTIYNGRDKCDPLHSMYYNYVGKNFLGKFNNTKQHIQFIEYILGNIILPDVISDGFFTDCKEKSGHLLEYTENIKRDFFNCDVYIFEVCSLKIYNIDGYEVSYQHTNKYKYREQTEQEIYDDLIKIRSIIPLDKHIVIQGHFRPQIVYGSDHSPIAKREIICNAINHFINDSKNVSLCDPSYFLKDNQDCTDDDIHFNDIGHIKFFDYLYEWILSQTNK
jgi:hypothetical protein